MAFISNNTSKFALVEQSAKGSPALPSDGTTYMAVQEGFTLTPTRETADNAELRGDISSAEAIALSEGATGSFDHYMRASGTEGVAPDHGLVLDNLLGDSAVVASEYLTTAASTVSLIKLASGGSSLSTGMSILIKDPTNGYSVRPVFGIATNDLTLGFNVANAPATGLGIGKPVHYKPANTSAYLTAVDYRGDGGLIQVAPDMRVQSGTITVEAGQPINSSYNLVGITGMYSNPILIGATSKYVDFKDNGGAELSAILTEKLYRDPYELAIELATKMNALATSNITVSYNPRGTYAGKFSIVSDGTTLELLGNTGTNTANSAMTKFGYTNTLHTAALTYYSDVVQSYASAYTPALDATNVLVAKDNTFLFGDATETTCLKGSSVTFTIDKEITNAMGYCAASGIEDAVINKRTITIEGVAYLDTHDLFMWEKYKNYTTTSLAYTAGQKSASNWIPGTVVQFYAPYFKIESYEIASQDGIVVINYSGTAFNPGSGIGQFFITML